MGKSTNVFLRLGFSAFVCSFISHDVLTAFIESLIPNSFIEFLYLTRPSIVEFIMKIGLFTIIFFLSRFIVNFVIEFFDLFLSMGIVGRINRVFGCLLSMFISLSIAYYFARFTERIIYLEIFENSRLVSEFDGGPVYKVFTNLIQ